MQCLLNCHYDSFLFSIESTSIIQATTITATFSQAWSQKKILLYSAIAFIDTKRSR